MIDWDTITEEQPPLRLIPEMLRKAASLHRFSAGAVLYRRGEPPRSILCVLEGEIRLVRHSPAGAEIILQRSRGGFIAEASMEASTYHCDVIAAEDGRLLHLPLPVFRAALEDDPVFNRAWIGHLSRELRRMRAQSERLNLNSAAERILHYIETEGGNGAITLRQTRKAWAAELGLSHEALYRTLRRLRDEGVLHEEGNQIAFPPGKGRAEAPPSR